jgi:hypothetical protein
MAIRTFNSVGGYSVGNDPVTIILANGDITTGNATLTGNLAALNVKTDNLLYANGVPWEFQKAAGTANYQIQYNLNNNFAASANFTFDAANNVLSVNGAANVNSLNSTGNITAPYFIGNVQGNISGNIVVPGNNTAVLFNDNGNAGASDAFTFDKSTNVVTITGNLITSNANLGNLAIANFFQGTLTTNAQPNITSVGTLTTLEIAGTGSVTGANLVSANFITGTLTTAAQPNITSVGTLGNLAVQGNIQTNNISVGNVLSANLIGGTLTTNAQPNITSVGTLGNLVVSGNANVGGNVNAANLGVSGNVLTSLIPSIDNNYDLGATAAKWKDLYISNINIGETYIKSTGNVITTEAANVANALSSGSLTVRNDAIIQGNASISGNLVVSGNTTYINVTELNITDPLINLGGTANGGNAASYDGKDRGLILHNYYSNGSGPLNQAIIWKTANSEFQLISQANTINDGIVTASSFGNIRGETFFGNLNGTVLQASQPNITSVGTLGNLVISGNLQVNTTANINALKAGGLTYPGTDGTAGQVIATYGNGELYFASVSTSSISNGNSNVSVAANGNITISSAGNANIVTVTGTGVIVNGTLEANGSFTANGNVSANSVVLGTTTIQTATLTTTSTAANQTIATVSTVGTRGVFFDIKGEESAGGKYSIATVTAVHDGATVDYTVYGTVLLGGSTGVLAVNIAGGNIFLGVTPASSNSTVWTTQYRTI